MLILVTLVAVVVTVVLGWYTVGPGGSNKARVGRLAERENPDDALVLADVRLNAEFGGCEVYELLWEAADYGSDSYAVLPGGELVSSYRESAEKATTVLRACAEGQPAQRWAEIVVNFGGGPIDGVGRAGDLAGERYHPPTLRTVIGAKRLTFDAWQTMGPAYYVTVDVPDDGTITIGWRLRR
ncbi:hypothetical protein [Nocardioides speluncae]|uniref:hypothetical protein n=1 Tax=Nocardioides speluncae TaxID=2670337 RepID=UPI000D697D78|nr:hypothetical protein [Nocardioides speluncae]